MKRVISFLLTLVLIFIFCFTGCGNNETLSSSNASNTDTQVEAITTILSDKAESNTDNTSDILVLYFSCTGNTQNAAEEIAKQTKGDILEIIPKEPCTSDDLNYNNDCRANREQNDSTARPEIKNTIENFDSYKTYFIGYPIWWGTAPKIINTLLDTYDFSGKKIIPFCTSGSSGIKTSVSVIKEAEPNAEVDDGLRVSDISEIKDWINGLGI